MIRRPPRSTQSRSSAASDVYKRQVDYTLDDGSSGPFSRSANMNVGIGTTIDFGIPLRLQANFYDRYWGENYGLANANSWDGYRVQFVYSYPIMTFANGAK